MKLKVSYLVIIKIFQGPTNSMIVRRYPSKVVFNVIAWVCSQEYRHSHDLLINCLVGWYMM